MSNMPTHRRGTFPAMERARERVQFLEPEQVRFRIGCSQQLARGVLADLVQQPLIVRTELLPPALQRPRAHPQVLDDDLHAGGLDTQITDARATSTVALIRALGGICNTLDPVVVEAVSRDRARSREMVA